MAGAGPSAVDADILYFSSDPKFVQEKPYTTSFPVDDIPGAKVSNQEFEITSVRIQDVKSCFEPDLDVHGFAFVRHPTRLTTDCFKSTETIKNEYYPELVALLRRYYPQYKSVAFFDHVVRQRVGEFPSAVGKEIATAQPYRYTHVDFSSHGARLKLQDALGSQAEERLKEKFDVLNIWRLLEGPTRDWPLTFCDWRTVDPDKDIIANDVVYRRGLGESNFLLRNTRHKWYYMAGQWPDDVAIFRNTNVPDGDMPRGFHTAFYNPLADNTDKLRQSIEVRLAAFY